MLLAIDVRHIHHTTSFPHALTDNSPLSSTALGAGASRCLHLLTHVPVSRIKDIIFYSPPARRNVHRQWRRFCANVRPAKLLLFLDITVPMYHPNVYHFSLLYFSPLRFCSLLFSAQRGFSHFPVSALLCAAQYNRAALLSVAHTTTTTVTTATTTTARPSHRPPPKTQHAAITAHTLRTHMHTQTHTHNQRPTSSSCTLHHVHITPCVRRIAPTLTHHINHATTVSIPHTHQPTYHHAPHFSIPFPTPFPSTSCDHRSSSVLSLSLSLSQRAILTTTSNTTPLAITQYA